MNTASNTVHDLGNNERVSTGMFKTSGGFLAMTRAASKEFKTERGAVAWLAQRGLDADGTRLPE